MRIWICGVGSPRPSNHARSHCAGLPVKFFILKIVFYLQNCYIVVWYILFHKFSTCCCRNKSGFQINLHALTASVILKIIFLLPTSINQCVSNKNKCAGLDSICNIENNIVPLLNFWKPTTSIKLYELEKTLKIFDINWLQPIFHVIGFRNAVFVINQTLIKNIFARQLEEWKWFCVFGNARNSRKPSKWEANNFDWSAWV